MSKQSFNEEGMGPLERGRGRYQKKDYPGALAAFKEVRRSIRTNGVTSFLAEGFSGLCRIGSMVLSPAHSIPPFPP